MKHFCTFFTLLLFPFLSVFSQKLIEYKLLQSIEKEKLQEDFGALLSNGVELYSVCYITTGLDSQIDTASGLLGIPVLNSSQALPLLSYQHGTVSGRDDVPSKLAGGFELPLVWSGLGYVVSAADFIGLGKSRGFHPYVHAETEARAAIDMLFAVQEVMEDLGRSLNGQLFVTGYSQGGHAAMATHRELEAQYNLDFQVTASAPMSGPYSISGEMKNIILGDNPYFFPNYVCWTILSYNLAHRLGYEIDAIFKPEFVAEITNFYEEKTSLSELNRFLTGQLDTLYGAVKPKFLFQDSIITAIATQPDHPFNLAMKENDVFNWTPLAPTRLLYCMADEQVTFRNSVFADSVMNALGAFDLDAIDVNPAASHGGCIEPAVITAALFFSTFSPLTSTVATPEGFIAIKLSPNPFQENLHVQSTLPFEQYQIFDPTGRLVKQSPQLQEQTELTVPLASLPPGVYFITIQGKSWKTVEKIIKQ